MGGGGTIRRDFNISDRQDDTLHHYCNFYLQHLKKEVKK